MEKTNSNRNTGKWITAGVAVTGLSLVLMNRKARSKVMDTSMSVKNAVADYASSIKADPSAMKDSLINRIKQTSSITMEAVNKIQDILNNEGKDMKETASHLIDDTKEMVSQAMDTKEDLKTVKDKAMDAKDTMTGQKESNRNEATNKNNAKSNSDSKLSKVGAEKPAKAFAEDSVKRTGANKGGNQNTGPIKR